MYKELPMAVQFLHIIEKTIFQNTIILTFFSDIHGSQLLSTWLIEGIIAYKRPLIQPTQNASKKNVGQRLLFCYPELV